MKILNKISTKEEEIDMNRLHTIINRRKLDTLSNLEYSPCDSIAFYVIGHFLYGNDEKDLYERLNTVEACKKMVGETPEYWLNLFNKYFSFGILFNKRINELLVN